MPPLTAPWSAHRLSRPVAAGVQSCRRPCDAAKWTCSGGLQHQFHQAGCQHPLGDIAPHRPTVAGALGRTSLGDVGASAQEQAVSLPLGATAQSCRSKIHCRLTNAVLWPERFFRSLQLDSKVCRSLVQDALSFVLRFHRKDPTLSYLSYPYRALHAIVSKDR